MLSLIFNYGYEFSKGTTVDLLIIHADTFFSEGSITNEKSRCTRVSFVEQQRMGLDIELDVMIMINK